MAKARARTTARKVKDRWKAKSWYQVLAPPLFDQVPVADTLCDKPANLIGRVTEVSLQNLTNDFRKSHIKLFFKIHNVEESTAQTQFIGHTLTSDYLRRMIRRRKSRIDGIYDITTRDGAIMRVKPFATTDRRIQNSQKKLIREAMGATVLEEGKTKTLNEFIRDAIDGKTGSNIYKNCKKLYPVKRIEIYKTEVKRQPTIEVEEKKPKKEEAEPAPEIEKTEEKKKVTKKKEPKKTKEPEKETAEEKPKKVEEKKPTKKPKETKKSAKKPAAKKTTKKKTTAKKAATKSTTKKKATKKS